MTRSIGILALLALISATCAPEAAAQSRPPRGTAQNIQAPAQGDAGKEPAFIALSGGWFDMFDDEQAAAFGVDYVFSQDNKLWLFTPFIGATVNTDAWAYAYAGIGIDVFWGRRIVTTPSFAIGVYAEGDGKDLGSALEFRSGLDIAYRFDDRSRLGVGFYHVSNAGITERNPGTEILVLKYSLPIGD